eukprot:TRINITY_DN115282_c0_g1_i1.p1 TRINITY_DN115282_c0_g1~~TRINITY_DN115282_c0_g1_i1.p1  ORF type:complete len:326 (-),score=38.22 TRINITY_DN115282_c0_g1_i1:71-922(-)
MAVALGLGSPVVVRPTKTVCASYVAILAVCTYVYFRISDMLTSSIYTFASVAHCLAICFQYGQVLRDRRMLKHQSVHNAAGALRTSGVSVVFSQLALSCRLSSTTWLNGYVPMDASGDWLYQAIDVAALAVTLPLLLLVAVNERRAGTRMLRWQNFARFVAFAFAVVSIAVMFYGDMNDRPIYDALWMAGALFGIAAVVPQLWKSEEGERCRPTQVENFDHHAIVSMCVGQMMSFTYLWMARNDVAYTPLVEDVNHPVYVLLAAHAVALRLVCDFTGYAATDA